MSYRSVETVIIEEWIEELATTQRILSHEGLSSPALTALRSEILALLERAKHAASVHLPTPALKSFSVH